MTMGAARTLEALLRRELSAEQHVRDCLSRTGSREPAVQAWEVLDAEGALREARRIDGLRERPPLCGLAAGVKDLIDTRNLPTTYGSPIHRGHRPARDAACVRTLREAGAIVLGKTVTTEFASFTPGKTRNPHDPARTPGGSSSGSAAAVADGMVPFALGTQTAGSVIRPASFCGVIGWKPAFGELSLEGVHPLAPSLDTLGFFVRELADVPLVSAALAGRAAALARSSAAGSAPPAARLRLPPAPEQPVFGLCRTHLWERAEPSARRAVEEAAARLSRSGAEVREVELPPSFAGLFDAQVAIMGSEMAVSLKRELDEQPDRLSPRLREVLAAGRACSASQIAAARALAAVCRAELRPLLAPFDALLTLGAAGEAPPADTTGDPAFCRIWTLLGAPCVSLPVLRGPAGLPIGLQLVGKDEVSLLAASAFVLSACGVGADGFEPS